MYDAFFSSTLIMAETWSVVNFTINGREDLKGIHITNYKHFRIRLYYKEKDEDSVL